MPMNPKLRQIAEILARKALEELRQGKAAKVVICPDGDSPPRLLPSKPRAPGARTVPLTTDSPL